MLHCESLKVSSNKSILVGVSFLECMVSSADARLKPQRKLLFFSCMVSAKRKCSKERVWQAVLILPIGASAG
jgi:hypothetical protein